MFRLSSLLSALGMLLLGTLWITYLSYFKGESLSESQRGRLKQSLTESALATAKQSRTKVRKDVWVSQPNHQRLQNRIDSQLSLLTLKPKKNSVEIVEQLYNVECWSQEKMMTTNSHSPSYQMRALKAKEGTYKYETQTFEASEATLALYKIPGVSLITNLQNQQAFLKGTAEQVSFAVQSGVPCFQAHQFKASLSSPGGKP